MLGYELRSPHTRPTQQRPAVIIEAVGVCHPNRYQSNRLVSKETNRRRIFEQRQQRGSELRLRIRRYDGLVSGPQGVADTCLDGLVGG